MLHPSLLDLVAQQRLADLERENAQRRLYALVPKPRYVTRLVAFVGTHVVLFGTWMQSAQPRNA